MGMNFYVVKRCWFCKNEKLLHIGKSSSGSKFLFQVNDGYESNTHSLFHYLKWKHIEDEMHRRISRKNFFEMVANKEGGKTNKLCNHIDKYSFEWTSVEFS